MESDSESLFAITPSIAPKRKAHVPKRHVCEEGSEEGDFIPRKLFSPAKKANGEPGPSIIPETPGTSQQQHKALTFHNLVKTGQPYLELWRCQMGVDYGSVEPVPQSGRRTAFRRVAVASVCVILDECLERLNRMECQGCQHSLGNMMAHTCLAQDETHYDRLLRHICERLQIVPVLNLIVLFASSIECCVLNQNCINSLAKLVKSISNSRKAYKAFKKVKERCHAQYFTILEKYLSQSGRTENILDIFL